MIRNKKGYENTLELIADMEEAIKDVKKNYKGIWRKLFLEGPTDMLKQLKTEARDYERRQMKKAS